MGVCEGRPSSVLPDHMGRADYHGASINQAARFMDAGKYCLSASIFSSIKGPWRYELFVFRFFFPISSSSSYHQRPQI